MPLQTSVAPLAAALPQENDTNLMNMYKAHIAQKLAPIIDVAEDKLFNALDTSIKLENGDLTLPVPKLRIAGNQTELVKSWAASFKSDLVKADVDGVFLRFHFDHGHLLRHIVPRILTEKDKYGQNNSGKGKTVIVEYSSVNIAKPFHAGHLRTTILGSYLSNIFEFSGYKVIRINYLGDWGKQFGLLAVAFLKYGNEEELKNNPIKHMYQLYVRISAEVAQQEEEIKKGAQIAETLNDLARNFFKRMEDAEPEAVGLWKRFRDYSIENLKQTYSRLNIKFDYYAGESLISLESMSKLIAQLETRGHIVEIDGAKLIDFGDKSLGKTVLQRKDGSTLYITRDIGEAVRRYEDYKFDKMIYVVASQQDLHLKQLFKTIEYLGVDWADRLEHINFGMVRGMSTRKGTVVFLEDILDTAKEQMHEIMKSNKEKYALVKDPENVADEIGRTGIIIQDMSAKRCNNYAFSWDRMLSFEGDTGPYLQYAHSRLVSVSRNSIIVTDQLLDADFSLLKEPQATNLARILVQFPQVIENSLKSREAVTLVSFLFKVTHLVSKSYDVLWVQGQEKELAKARLALFQAAQQVLHTGMKIVGLNPLDRM